MKKILITMMLVLASTMTFAQEKQLSIQETLQPYVEKLLNGIEQGVEMASKEIPDVLVQYVTFAAFKAWFIVGLGVVLLTLTIILGNKALKEQWDDCSGPAVAIYIFGSVISLTLFFGWIFDAIKATFFPKLYLIEEFIKLI